MTLRVSSSDTHTRTHTHPVCGTPPILFWMNSFELRILSGSGPRQRRQPVGDMDSALPRLRMKRSIHWKPDGLHSEEPTTPDEILK